MNFEIVFTDNFLREIKKMSKKYKSIKSDFESFLDNLENNPFQGVPLGQDCYKVRMAITSKNKGKSGGARIITCVKITKEKVILLSIYDKKEQDSISDNEIDKLLKHIDFN
jgi:mRNA-degrading endonuclease RelE of RelBE toxin-antitoxin system